MANITINTATTSHEILLDRPAQAGSIQRRVELMEGVRVTLGDERQNPNLVTLTFIALGTNLATSWSVYDTIKAACENAVSLTIEGVTKPVTALKRFTKKVTILNFRIEAQFIMRDAYPLVGVNTNYLPANALLLADDVPFLLADGMQGLEA